MANSANNLSGWLIPSFNFDQSERPVLKKPKTESVKQMAIDDFSKVELIPKAKNTTNLSLLLSLCAPKVASDLAVQQKKLNEISEWLKCRTNNCRPATLVLTGPSGCGKATTIKLLAKEHGFDVTEWITPMDEPFDENNIPMRQGDKFEGFVIRTTRYGSLLSKSGRRLLIVKEFPNAYYDNKESFWSFLERYYEMGKDPIVFISTDEDNSKLMQTLLNADVRTKFGIVQIKVNAVTQKKMITALKRVSKILNSNAGEILRVTDHSINEVVSNNVGDIRSALLNLIFISLKVPKGISNRGNTAREERVGFLHAIGRVLYPKLEKEDSLQFTHDPDDLAAYFQSQPSITLSFLEENYLKTLGNIQQAFCAADTLSLSAHLSNNWHEPNLTKLILSFCVRALMINNKKPAKGWNLVNKPSYNQREICRKKCLETAEIRFYESVIKPKSNIEAEEELDCGEEGIME